MEFLIWKSLKFQLQNVLWVEIRFWMHCGTFAKPCPPSSADRAIIYSLARLGTIHACWTGAGIDYSTRTYQKMVSKWLNSIDKTQWLMEKGKSNCWKKLKHKPTKIYSYTVFGMLHFLEGNLLGYKPVSQPRVIHDQLRLSKHFLNVKIPWKFLQKWQLFSISNDKIRNSRMKRNVRLTFCGNFCTIW